MWNIIGRSLILIYTTCAVLVMGWALITFLRLDDYGWLEPLKVWDSKDTGYRVASDLDKKTAALQEQYRMRERSLPAIQPSLDALAESMDRFPKNHLFYVAELEKLRS